MVSDGFCLLWQKILQSSLWVKESKETRLVWITLLAMKNKDGRVISSVVGLADRAKVSVEECRDALDVLKSPDPDDTSKVEQGRRIREIQGGWEIINHEMYRFSTEAKREMWRQAKAEQRLKDAEREKRLKMKRKGPTKAELIFEQNGDDPEPGVDFKLIKGKKSVVNPLPNTSPPYEPEPTPNPENEPF